MDINQVFVELDRLFNDNRINEVGPYLKAKLVEATAEGDDMARITIMNEQIGFHRDTSEYDLSLHYCDEVLSLMESMGLTGTKPYATTLINVATVNRAAGNHSKSLEYFAQVKAIYDKLLAPNDMLVASYYNNVALVYQEMNKAEEACDALKHALSIVETYPEASYEQATSHGNLGNALMQAGSLEDAKKHLERAIELYKSSGNTGYHYSAALSGMGEACYRSGDYQESLDYYHQAAQVIKDTYGENNAYHTMLDNIAMVEVKLK